MTGRWITVSLVALALAGCHKKEAEKPPAPTAETPTTTATTTTTTTTPATTTETPPPSPSDAPATPPVDPTATVPTPPAPGVTPVTSPDAPPTLVPVKPIRMVVRPLKAAGAPSASAPAPAARAAPIVVLRPGGRPPPIKSPIQVKAERDILGLWTEQKSHNAIVNFTYDGRVTYVEKITDTPKWTGRWKAGADGVVLFTLAMPGATSSLEYSAYPTASKIMAIAPHWTKEWGGSGQYAYERLQ